MKKIVHKRRFPADLLELHSMILWIREKAAIICFSKRDLFHIELALEEAIVNIIRHGYLQKKGEIELSVETDGALWIQILDEAPPFNPLQPEQKKEPVEEGGVGIDLMLRCMDEVLYQRKGLCNILILKKKRPKEP